MLIAATEHYGSVINRPFDFERYLADAADKHQTMTRTFLLFREQQIGPQSVVSLQARVARFRHALAAHGSRQRDRRRASITTSTSGTRNTSDRLHRFLSRASELGIVVELTLFSNTYGDSVWALNPLRAENNLQGVGKIPWYEYNTLHNEPLVERQMAYALENHPERPAATTTSTTKSATSRAAMRIRMRASPTSTRGKSVLPRLVRDELARLKRPHLVFGSQAFSYKPAFRQELDKSFAEKTFDAVNVHPLPGLVLAGKEYMLGNFMSKQLVLKDFRDFCRASQAFRKPCVPDEDNTASMYRDPIGWTIHRKRAWIALFSQCHYDYIDFSITVGSETGTRQSNRMLRTWMKHLVRLHADDRLRSRTSRAGLDRPEASSTSSTPRWRFRAADMSPIWLTIAR